MYDLFSIKDFSFPKDFAWGTATAGHQIEGDNVNAQKYYEEKERAYDPTGIIKPSGKACNHYEMVEEDTKLLSELKIPNYRMSVEWSRIEPTEGFFDESEIEHYIKELFGLKEKGIKVFLTLHHFTHPMWFEKCGGFKKPENIKYFERFCEKVVPLFSPYVDSWNVLNEFNGSVPEFERMQIMRFHARGYHIIKKYSNAPVSSAHALVMYEPTRRYDAFDCAAAKMKDTQFNEFFFHGIRTGEVVMPGHGGYFDKDIKDTCDYWAVNIYTREMVDARKIDFAGERYAHKKLEMIPMKFYLDEMFPETMIHSLTRLMDKPVYITENGCSCLDDDWRIVYITLYLNALHEAMELGVDVKGYFYWSFLDNFEWYSFVPRFGIVDVNFETYERNVKKSACFYKDIIEKNGFSQDILRKYLKKVPGSDF